MAIVDRTFGAVWTVGCEESECTSPMATQVVGDQFSQPDEAALAERVGTRVEYRSGGTPVVAHRHADGSARVLDCADAACAQAEERQIAAPVWNRPLPGFDLDSQDRPQLLTADHDSGRLLPISCLDTGCAETVEPPLSPFDEVPLHTALTMDEQDRPHLLSVGAELPAVHAEHGPGGVPASTSAAPTPGAGPTWTDRCSVGPGERSRPTVSTSPFRRLLPTHQCVGRVGALQGHRPAGPVSEGPRPQGRKSTFSAPSSFFWNIS